MVIGRNAKMVLALAAIAIMLLFSEMRAGTLLAIAVGAGLVLLGLASYYRPASVVGFMIAAGGAAVSNNPGSLTVVASWLNAIFGILIPVYVLAWVALNSAQDQSYQMMLRSKASAYTLMFMLACLVSVPVVALLTGLVSPHFSTAMSILTEIAIVLTVVTAGLIMLTAQMPRSGPVIEPVPEEGPD